MLSEQVPSDPDEPFFILSLTEIPVSSSGEVVDSAAEPFSYLPATVASVAQQRFVPVFISLSGSCGAYFVWFLILQLYSPLSGLPGETLEAAAAGDASLSDAAITITTEESGEMSLTNVKDSGLDPTTHKVSEVSTNHFYLQFVEVSIFVTVSFPPTTGLDHEESSGCRW